MNNLTEKKQNGLTIEQWFMKQNPSITNEKEIQRFKSNVVALMKNDYLNKADIKTVLSSAYQATLLNLPLEQNFGYCWVVPYKGQAQFQMGWKGYVQLALRSQQYKDINVMDVRQGEIKKFDRLKGIKFNWIFEEDKRLKAPIIGYVANFKLKNGFYKELYMSKEQIQAHFMKYSESYKKYKTFKVGDFDSMALKTTLTQLLRKWGIMSVEMQQAYESDQAVITDNEKIYIDNPNNTIQENFYNELTNPKDNGFENAQEIINEYNEQENKKITQEHINNIKTKRVTNNTNPTFTVPNYEDMQNDIDNLELED